MRTLRGPLLLIDPEKGTVISRMPALTSENWLDGDFSRDGQRLAALLKNGDVAVWDLETRRTVQLFQKAVPDFYVGASHVAISPTGDAVSWVGLAKEVSITDLRSGKSRRTFKLNENSVRLVAFSPDGRNFAAAADNRFGVWDAGSGQEVATIDVTGLLPRFQLRFSPDGNRLAFSVQDYRDGANRRTACLWDFRASPQKVVVLPGVQSEINNLAWSPDGEILATVGEDLCLRVWDVGMLLK